MSDEVPPATAATVPPTRRRRRGLLGALVLLVALYVLPPLIARPLVERALAGALNMPVSIAHLWWRPWAGEVTASRLLFGAEQHQVSVDRLTIDADLVRVVHGEIVIDRVVFDKPLATVALDARYRPEIKSFSGGGTSESRLPDFLVRRLLVNDGVLTVRYPVERRTRDATVRINRLAAADVSVRNAGSELEAGVDLAGSLDGASLNGKAKLRLAATKSNVDATVGIKGLAVNRDLIDLPASLQTFSGKVDALAKYEVDRESPSGSLALELRIEEPRCTVGAQTELGAKGVSMPNARVDFDKRTVDLGTVTAEAPLFTIVLNNADVARAAKEDDHSAASLWTVTSGAVELRGGKIQVRRGTAATTLALNTARWGGVAGAHPTTMAADAATEGGGAVVLRGTLALAPPNAALNVHLDGLVLTPLAQLVPELPVTIAKGTLQGTLDLEYRNGSARVLGSLQARDVQSAPPAPNRETQVMAIHTAAAEFVVVPTASPWLDVTSLKLSYPYLMAELTSRGLFPISLFSTTDEPAPARSGRTANGEPMSSVRLHQVEIDGGKLEFMDRTLNPEYWASLTDISMRLSEALLPALTIGRFEITGKEDEISPTEIAGMLTPEGLEGRAAVTDLLLESMNPYVAAILGYKATAGRMSLNVVASPAPPLLKTTTDLVAGSIDVEQTGVDLIQSQSGVPLRVALSLIKNLAGEITLRLPVAVDTSTRSVAVGSIVGQAIRSAIVGALTSPLRLLGSLFGLNGAPHAFAIDPIPFAVGSGSLDAVGQERIAQVGRILQSHPGLILVAMPQVTAADIEQVGADGSRDLAERRIAAVRSALVTASTGLRLAPNRLMPVAWEPSATAIAGPGVYVELQAQ